MKHFFGYSLLHFKLLFVIIYGGFAIAVVLGIIFLWWSTHRH